MSRVTITIKGLSDVQSRLQQVVPKVETATEVILDAVAFATQADAQQICPVDTGLLRNSIGVFSERLLRQVGTDVEYAWYVHDGTKKMSARPYLTPPFESHQAELVAVCQKIEVV